MAACRETSCDDLKLCPTSSCLCENGEFLNCFGSPNGFCKDPLGDGEEI